MAFLFRSKYVEYRLPDGSYRTPNGKRVTKDTPNVVRTVRESDWWYGRWVERDRNGNIIRRCQQKLSKSKERARSMLARFAGDAELSRVGQLDFYAKHKRRPLADHLEDYLRGLAAKGDSVGHVNRIRAQVGAILAGCGFERTEDITAGAVLDFLAGLRNRPQRPRIPLDAKR